MNNASKPALLPHARTFILLELSQGSAYAIYLALVSLVWAQILEPSKLLLTLAVSLSIEAAMEVPTGWLADRFGKGRVVVCGSLASGLAMALYAINPYIPMSGFPKIILIETVLTLGIASVSGSLEAWYVNEEDINVGSTDGIGSVFATIGTWKNILWLAFGGSVLLLRRYGTWAIPSCFAFAALCYFFAAILAIARLDLNAEPVAERKEATKRGVHFWKRAVVESIRAPVFVFANVLVMGAGLLISYSWTRLLKSDGDTGHAVILPWLSRNLWVVWCCFLVAKLAGARLIQLQMRQDQGIPKPLTAMRISTGGCLIGMGAIMAAFAYDSVANGVFGIVVLILNRGASDYVRPTLRAITNQAIQDNAVRATALSIREFFPALVAILVACVSEIFTIHQVQYYFAGFGIVLFVSGWFTALIDPKLISIRKKDNS